MGFREASCAAVMVAGAALTHAGVAAANTCTYDPATRAVAITIDEHFTDTVYVGNRGTIESSVTGTCGAATVKNTDAISVSGTPTGSESLWISQHNGPFAREKGPRRLRTEIKFSVDLGGWNTFFTADRLTVVGTEEADAITLGTSGFDLNSDGDLDVAVANDPETHAELAGGSDSFTAEGGPGAGAMYASALTLSVWGATEFQPIGALGEGDTITGRDGSDLLYGSSTATNTVSGLGGDDGVFGGWGDDVLFGGPGVDSMAGDNGNDTVSGGDDGDNLHGGGESDTINGDAGDDTIDGEPGGPDVLNGGPGNDLIRARDGSADTIDGGEGDADRASVDASLDTWVNVEEVFFF